MYHWYDKQDIYGVAESSIQASCIWTGCSHLYGLLSKTTSKLIMQLNLRHATEVYSRLLHELQYIIVFKLTNVLKLSIVLRH